MERNFGISGELFGKARESERIFRHEGASQASGRSAEQEFVRETAVERERALRTIIRELDENILAIRASIGSLAAKIREGRRIAAEKGYEKLSSINARLEDEAKQAQYDLLGEEERLKMKKQELEAQLEGLSA